MRLRWWVFLSAILAILSLGGLYGVVSLLWPEPDSPFALPQVLFFICWFLFLGAVTIPPAAYLNYRFAKAGWLQLDKFRLVRQAAWVGLFGVIVAYLQLVRELSFMMSAILGLAFILIEVFFLTRE